MSAFEPWTGSNFKHDQPTRKRLKGRKNRAEARVKRLVRAEVTERDGYCLVATRIGMSGCKGRSTWAHFAGHRRSQTRGMAPERRHDSRFSGMLCERHHSQEERGLYQIVYRTVDYANGPIGWEPRQQKETAA
jgi:hypothetical protein